MYFQLIEIVKKESYIFVPFQLLPPFTCKILEVQKIRKNIFMNEWQLQSAILKMDCRIQIGHTNSLITNNLIIQKLSLVLTASANSGFDWKYTYLFYWCVISKRSIQLKKKGPEDTSWIKQPPRFSPKVLLPKSPLSTYDSMKMVITT